MHRTHHYQSKIKVGNLMDIFEPIQKGMTKVALALLNLLTKFP